jgi:hypothetical protein
VSPQEARALAMAHELRQFLVELNKLPEHTEGCCVDEACDYMDDVINMLEPDEPPENIHVTPVTRLHLVKR